MIRGFLLTCLICILVSCTSNVPKGILEQQEMYTVMKDMIQVDQYLADNISKDSSIDIKVKRSELYEQVFALHKTSRSAFYKSYNYYQQHPNLQKTLFDSLTEGLKKKALPVQDKKHRIINRSVKID